MTEHRCPHIVKGVQCIFTTTSNKKLENHLLWVHDCYSDDKNIMEAVINHINKLQEQIRFILIRYPSARNSDEWLIETYKRIFAKTRVYNADTHSFQDRNPEGIPASKLAYQIREYDIVRARQLLQAKARKKMAGYEWKDLMPTDINVIRRRKQEEAWHDYLASVPDSE